MGWFPLDSEGWPGIASPPEPSGKSATESLCCGVRTAGFVALGKPKALLWVSVLTHPQMGGLSRGAFWVALGFLDSSCMIPLGTICSYPPPHSCLEGEGSVQPSGPPSKLPEGWEMSRQGNEDLLLIQA